MNSNLKKWSMSTLRWGIAIAGITYVLWNIRFHDRVRLLTSANTLEEIRVWNHATDEDARFLVGESAGREVTWDQLWTLPDRKVVDAVGDPAARQVKKFKLLALKPARRLSESRDPAALLVEDPDSHRRIIIPPHQIVGNHPIVSYPLVEFGINRMAREADWMFLLAAILLMPLTYGLTSYRWHLLLEALEIRISLARTFIINMVGAFYNSFMPGSTGGDLIKAYYASRHTTHRAHAVFSVLVDRIIGLLALVLLGGVMAAFQYHVPECRRVALLSAAVMIACVVGLFAFYQPTARRLTGLDWLLKRLPMQRFVKHVVHAMDSYGRRPRFVAWAFLSSFPVHVTTILSATLVGEAFHLPLSPLYYWVIVPVIALVGAIPISPQGAGVMEFFAVQLTIHRGVTVAQAVAFVMSLRLVSMFWNLIAGLFALRGGYHAPTETEQHELEDDDDDAVVESRDSPVNGFQQPASPIPVINPPIGG